MFLWLKRLLLEAKTRKKLAEHLAAAQTNIASNKNELPLDPKNDPWGRR